MTSRLYVTNNNNKKRIKVLKNDGKNINVEQIYMKWMAYEKVYFGARQKSTFLTFFDSF